MNSVESRFSWSKSQISGPTLGLKIKSMTIQRLGVYVLDILPLLFLKEDHNDKFLVYFVYTLYNPSRNEWNIFRLRFSKDP